MEITTPSIGERISVYARLVSATFTAACASSIAACEDATLAAAVSSATRAESASAAATMFLSASAA